MTLQKGHLLDAAKKQYKTSRCIVGHIFARKFEGLYSNKRGKGLRKKASGPAKSPNKWMEFLYDTKNKEELFAFLTT